MAICKWIAVDKFLLMELFYKESFYLLAYFFVFLQLKSQFIQIFIWNVCSSTLKRFKAINKV